VRGSVKPTGKFKGTAAVLANGVKPPCIGFVFRYLNRILSRVLFKR
jgi:hypothetical protein